MYIFPCSDSVHGTDNPAQSSQSGFLRYIVSSGPEISFVAHYWVTVAILLGSFRAIKSLSYLLINLCFSDVITRRSTTHIAKYFWYSAPWNRFLKH